MYRVILNGRESGAENDRTCQAVATAKFRDGEREFPNIYTIQRICWAATLATTARAETRVHLVTTVRWQYSF